MLNFFVDQSIKFYEGKYQIFDDKSFCFDPCYAAPFSILLNNWRFDINCVMNEDNESGHLVLFGGFLFDELLEKTKLVIPKANKAGIAFNGVKGNNNGVGGIDYALKGKAYFDIEIGWICVGELSPNSLAIEFATKTYAIIKNGQLKTIYAKIR